MKYKYNLSCLEKTVMDILLDVNQSLGYKGIENLIVPQHKWSKRTIRYAIKRLIREGLIQQLNITKASGSEILYRAAMTKTEFYDAAYSEYFKMILSDPSSSVFPTSKRERRDQEVVEEVEAWLNNQKKMLSQNDDLSK